MSIRVSAVLPCFEEADQLDAVVSELSLALETAASGFEIILVTSAAARDATVKVARRIAAANDSVRTLVQPADDPGYGRALALGIAEVREEWTLLFDGDGQFDPGDLQRFVTLSDQAEVIVGYRSPRRDPLGRRVAGRLYAPVASLLAGVRVRDPDCAFKLLRTDVIRGADLRSRSGVVNAELLGEARRRGARIRELPVHHRERRGGRAQYETGLGLPRGSEVLRILREVAALGVLQLRAR